MDATTYIISRTILKGVCGNNENSSLCEPLNGYTIFLILLVIFLFFTVINFISFYKEQKKAKKGTLTIFLIWIVTLPKRIYLFIKDAYKEEKDK